VHSTHAQASRITRCELDRLGTHSQLTQDLVKAKTDYGEFGEDEGTLYTHISNACQVLRDHKNEPGKLLDKSGAVYQAISTLKSFYDEYQRKYPDKPLSSYFKSELDLLIGMLSDQFQVSKSQDMTTRDTTLRTILANMGWSSTGRIYSSDAFKRAKTVLEQRLIIKKERTYAEYFKKVLTRQSVEKIEHYMGKDTLDTTPTLLRTLGVLKILAIKNDSMLPDVLSPKSSLTIQDLKKLLKPLSDECRIVILEDMGKLLHNLVKSINDFAYVNKFLPVKESKVVFEQCIKANIYDWVLSAKDFKIIRDFLSEDEVTEFLAYLKRELPDVWVEIVYEDFITTIKESVLRELKQDIKIRWLAYQGTLVDKDIEERDVLHKLWHLGKGLTTYEKSRLKQQLTKHHPADFESI